MDRKWQFRGEKGRGRLPLAASGLLAALLLLALLPQGAQAAPKVTIYNIAMEASPPVAGRGLPVEISATVDFGGACCYVVYARGCRAQITVAPGLEITDGGQSQNLTTPGEKEPGRVAALPGGGYTKVAAKWTVKGDAYGDYAVTVRASGYAIRSPEPDAYFEMAAQMTISVSKGAIPSSPVLPEPVSVGRDTLVLVNVTPVLGAVSKVLLNYSTDNRTWKSLPMSPVEAGSSFYGATVPARQAQGDLYFYFFTANTLNQTFTSATYREKTLDYGRINSIRDWAGIGLSAGGLLGVVFVTAVYSGILRIDRRRKEKGLLCIGADRRSGLSGGDGGEPGAYWRRAAKNRKLAAAVLLAAGIALAAAAAYLGYYQAIVDKTTGLSGP